MNSKKMFLSLVPWVLFSVIVNRHGAQAAAIAALAAAAVSLVLMLRNGRTGIKIIDVTGVVTFGLLGAGGMILGTPVTDWTADYGRGAVAILLAVIMLGSSVTIPFTEQYARESVPREYWHSPTFRSVNRRISALWGTIILVMGGGHLLAGGLDPATNPSAGARPVDLLLNWALPIGLILLAIRATERISRSAGNDAPVPDGQHLEYRSAR